MTLGGLEAGELLGRYVAGDWGDVGPADAAENELSLQEGFQILPSYGTGQNHLWIITEAVRSVTTIVRPEDYRMVLHQDWVVVAVIDWGSDQLLEVIADRSVAGA